MIHFGGEVNDQTQIVNTKLPNENIQTYQPQMIDSDGGRVNYQMQIVLKLPNGTTKMAQNDQFHLTHDFSNLLPLKSFRMTWNSQFCPIHNFSNLFPPKWLRMTQNSQFHLLCNFSNLFPPKWLRMTQNDQFCPIHNFYNLSHQMQIVNTKLPNKNIQTYQPQMIDSGGGG